MGRTGPPPRGNPMPQPPSGCRFAADPHREMTGMNYAFCVAHVVRPAVALPLADPLAARPMTAEEIAEREGSAPTTTMRLMRGCAAFGLLTVDEVDRYHATPLLDTLRTDAPRSLRGF